jgi:hypothetical protein
MVRVGVVADRPADMAKSSEWRTNFGRFCLRRGTGFAGLDGRKDLCHAGDGNGGIQVRGFSNLVKQIDNTNAGRHAAANEDSYH